MNFSKKPSKPSKPAEKPDINPPKSYKSELDPDKSAIETPASTAASPPLEDVAKDANQDLPIPPAGELMQYRAIGLVEGRYIPSAEQFTQGSLLSKDNTPIDAVLLGRVMSLVKKHIDLSQDHLWVVYPRIGKEDSKLHLQIVGIWEPQTLKADAGETQKPEYPTDTLKDGYFSIRGEVIYQSKEEPHIIVKIQQSARKQGEKPKFFKLKLQCSLAEKMIGHFWELNVQRQGETLVVESGTDICEMPKKKPVRKKFPPRKGLSSEGSHSLSPQKPIISKPVKDSSANKEHHPPNIFKKPIPKPSKRKIDD